MSIFNDRICTQYKKLPLCNPDFIYLDGPYQFNVKKDLGLRDILTISKKFGHSSVATTMDIYTHFFERKRKW